MKMASDTVIEIKRTMFELFLLIRLLYFFVSVRNVFTFAVLIQGWFLSFFFINSCTFYSRAASIQENTTLNVGPA